LIGKRIRAIQWQDGKDRLFLVMDDGERILIEPGFHISNPEQKARLGKRVYPKSYFGLVVASIFRPNVEHIRR
jgi:hypothetical protein